MKQIRCPNGLRVWSALQTGGEMNFIFREIFEDRCYERARGIKDLLILRCRLP